jgi:hypothetical protein
MTEILALLGFVSTEGATVITVGEISAEACAGSVEVFAWGVILSSCKSSVSLFCLGMQTPGRLGWVTCINIATERLQATLPGQRGQVIEYSKNYMA